MASAFGLVMVLGGCNMRSLGADDPWLDGGPPPDARSVECMPRDAGPPLTVPDGCVVEPSCWIPRLDLNYVPGDCGQIGETASTDVIASREAFETIWEEQYCCPDYPLPAPPPLDFTTQRVIWHTFCPGFGPTEYYPAVLRCGDHIRFWPRFSRGGPEWTPIYLTLVTIPKDDAPVVFEEPEFPSW
ncbi:MAG: hypothetical protein JRH20_28215 [Deltaproteobacteria bacterium]|nr:hypothetical protein [Deltaproteobacteria bacterium]